MYRVYVLENAAGKRYIGLSEDVNHRLQDHNSGVSTWTAKHGPWVMIWNSRELSLLEAVRLERNMKRQKGGSGLRTLMNLFVASSGS